MVIKIPQRHDFPEPLRKRFLEKTGCSMPEWEICVSRKQNLAWSIVLSYLMSTNYRDKDDFKKRLKQLTGSDENAKRVNKSIRSFNPFRNRCSCFYDETIKTVVKNFREHLGWTKSLSISNKLSVASKALECQIIFVQKNNVLKNFQEFEKPVESIRNVIVLIPCTFTEFDNPMVPVTVYNFMIQNAFGQRLKIAALKYFLKETDLPKKIIKKLVSVVSKENNFIKAVLKSNYEKAVLEVYNSPYVVSKLFEAGYEMDPRAKDSDGFCGIYYALMLKDTEILYKLYYFAVDNCCQAEVSYRDPDPNIWSNLLCIDELLLENLSKLKASNMNVKFNEILRLNTFLIKLNEKILKIKNRLNYYDSTPDIIFEATKRRDFVVSLLETYEMYFHFQDSQRILTLKDYMQHKDYYNSIDMVTAILFFDNIAFLKERLKLEGRQFSDIESSIFLFIMQNLALNTSEPISDIYKSKLENVYKLVFMYRLNIKDKLSNFSEILRMIDINNENVVERIPLNEVHSVLYSHQAIKNFFEVLRLKKYIQSIKEIRIRDIKEILAMERILQVIGECIAPSKKEDFSFRRFLSLCLPKEISSVLRSLRHDLTHLEVHAFPAKFRCEKNTSLFRSILSEIREIDNCFKPVYRIMMLSFCVHMSSLHETELKKMKDSPHSYFLSSEHSSSYANTDSTMIYKNFLKSFRSSCYIFFKMALINLEKKIENEYISKISSIDDLKHRIIYQFWPLKWLLELLKDCKMNGVNALLDLFIKLESNHIDCLTTLKEKTSSFIKECYKLLPKFNVKKERNIPEVSKCVVHIKIFKKILNGFVYLTSEEIDEIRKEIPEKIKQQVYLKDRLIKSVEEEGVTLNIDVHSAEFELAYLPKKKMKELRTLLQSENSRDHKYGLEILKTQDPIAEIEEIFKKNCVNKKKYDKLCEIMEFSKKTRKTLRKLVAGQKEKVSINNLVILFQRIQLLKKIVIDEDEEVQNLWLKIKREKSRQLIDEKIVRRYLRDFQFQAAIEMLFLDCTMLFEKIRLPEFLKIKSSKLYQGINIRNIISHGSPLIENLCEFLDPQEFPSDIVKKILLLIRDEDAVQAILQLHESANKDYTKLLQLINCDENDEYSELRLRIRNCDKWKTYVLLLPDTHRENIT